MAYTREGLIVCLSHRSYVQYIAEPKRDRYATLHSLLTLKNCQLLHFSASSELLSVIIIHAHTHTHTHTRLQIVSVRVLYRCIGI